MKSKPKVLIDTFPLLELILWECIEKFNWKHLTKELKILNNHKQLENFLNYLRYVNLCTITGVFVEIQGHRRRLSKNYNHDYDKQKKFWKLAWEEFLNLQLKEIHVDRISLDLNVIEKFDLVDATLFCAAKREKISVLSHDRDFLNYCKKNSIEVIPFEQYKFI